MIFKYVKNFTIFVYWSFKSLIPEILKLLNRLIFKILLLTGVVNFTNTYCQGELKILFIGNSITFYNDLPGMFESLALNAGKKIYVKDGSMMGYPLEDHCTYTHTINSIYEEAWDYVILQESPVRAMELYCEDYMFKYAIFLDSLIHDNNTNTQTIIFMPTAYADGLTFLSGERLSYNEMQEEIYNGTIMLADSLDAIIAPVGWAFKSVIQQKGLDLFLSDMVHPNVQGSYLGACVIYATIYQQSVLGNSYYASLPFMEAGYFQAAGSRIVNNYEDMWYLNTGIRQTNIYSENILVYPNPVYSELHIKNASGFFGISVSILDIETGQVFLFKEARNKSELIIDLTALNNRIYLLILKTPQGITTKKISKISR